MAEMEVAGIRIEKGAPGFAGTLPIRLLLAAQRFVNAEDGRAWIRQVWVAPGKGAVLASNGYLLMRAVLDGDALKEARWANPAGFDMVALNIERDGAKWLRSKLKEGGSSVRAAWRVGLPLRLRAPDGDSIRLPAEDREMAGGVGHGLLRYAFERMPADPFGAEPECAAPFRLEVRHLRTVMDAFRDLEAEGIRFAPAVDGGPDSRIHIEPRGVDKAVQAVIAVASMANAGTPR